MSEIVLDTDHDAADLLDTLAGAGIVLHQIRVNGRGIAVDRYRDAALEAQGRINYESTGTTNTENTATAYRSEATDEAEDIDVDASEGALDLAADEGLDLRPYAGQGRGPGGRIYKDDVEVWLEEREG